MQFTTLALLGVCIDDLDLEREKEFQDSSSYILEIFNTSLVV